MTTDKIEIELKLVDTDKFRDHKGKSRLTIFLDRITHESTSTCDWTDFKLGVATPKIMPYFFKKTVKKERISSVEVACAYQSDMDEIKFYVQVSSMGVADDIEIYFNDKDAAFELYTKIYNWVFNDNFSI